MKSYLRYEPSTQFGVISSPNCNSEYDYTGTPFLTLLNVCIACLGHPINCNQHIAFIGNLSFTGAGSLVHTWNLRQASCINAMGEKEPSYPYATGGEASILKRSPSRDNPMVAVGYTNGVVRLFNYLSESRLVCSLKGHRAAITSLCFDDDGALLVTGSADSDIVLWDLVTHTGVCRLRGHKDAVHGVAFISVVPSDATGGGGNKTRRLLVSVSKDTLLKVRSIATPLSHPRLTHSLYGTLPVSRCGTSTAAAASRQWWATDARYGHCWCTEQKGRMGRKESSS